MLDPELDERVLVLGVDHVALGRGGRRQREQRAERDQGRGAGAGGHEAVVSSRRWDSDGSDAALGRSMRASVASRSIT